jgi:tRNA(Ile)-lysidine synthase
MTRLPHIATGDPGRDGAVRLNPRDRTLERIAAHRIHADRLIGPGACVLVAVSGGPDSVALLHFLAHEREQTGGPASIAVGHVNHGLRGRESDEDAGFVGRLCESWGVPHFETRLPEGALPQRPDAIAPEAEARRLRYVALHELAARAGADAVAVAHTADDQAETVLFRLARGAGLRGLGGIRSRAKVHGMKLIRPLLDVTREQVLDYLARHGIPYREDASNASLNATRNYLRHEVIPRLQGRVNSAVREALLRQSALFRDADEYLEAEARRVLPLVLMKVRPGEIVLDARQLAAYPKLLRSYIFRSVLHDLDGVRRDLSARHVDVLHSLATQSRGRVAELPMGIHARREQGRIVVTGRKGEPAGEIADPSLHQS